MDWDRRRFDDRRGGESYRPAERSGRSPSRGYDGRHRRSPPRNRSRPRADTWVPSNRGYGRPRSRSPPDYRRRSRTPPFQGRGYGPSAYNRRRSPLRRISPRRDDRMRSPPPPRRPRSPYSEGRSRDASRGYTSPRRGRDSSPGGHDLRTDRRNTPVVSNTDKYNRPFSPKPHHASEYRSQSPSFASRRDRPPDLSRDQPLSRSRQASPTRIGTETSKISRRSSPSTHPDRGRPAPLKSRSRSPFRQSPPACPSTTRAHSPRRGTETVFVDSGKCQGDLERPSDKETSEQRQAGNVPTQPKHSGNGQSPPSGPGMTQRIASFPGRSPHSVSLLSAPTRPRRGPGPRENPWMGPSTVRRGPPTMPSHGAPSGPRASFTPPASVGGHRYSNPRSNSSASGAPPPASQPPNYLAGLRTIVPGGKALPSVLDATTEKRLIQLEADQEKLLEQISEIQRSKRAGLRDWDRLDRESSVCALKSELAEGHLQRMADETIGRGIPF